MKLAEEAQQRALAELDARIADRHGDLQQLGHAAGGGVGDDVVGGAQRHADADLRALDTARDAMDDIEAETLTKPKPPAKRRDRKKTTRAGIERTNRSDWRKTRDAWKAAGYDDLLSPANKQRIAAGLVPIVDEAWIRYFPGDAPLLGEPISIHHIKGSVLNVPLPKTRHEDAHSPGGTQNNPGGPGITGSLDDEARDDREDDEDDIAFA